MLHPSLLKPVAMRYLLAPQTTANPEGPMLSESIIRKRGCSKYNSQKISTNKKALSLPVTTLM